MRALRWFAPSAFVAAIAAAFVTVSCAPPAQQTSATGVADTLARGEYLTTLIGCQDCHTPGAFYGAPDASRQLSGSELGWQGPWGVTYASNLTPDRETGLGKWTRAQIVAALRTGQRPDGSPLLPPMPWPSYARLTDADANAIAAYLQSLPALAHHVPDKLAAGQPVKGPVIAVPPPGAWDAPRTAQSAGPGAPGGQARP